MKKIIPISIIVILLITACLPVSGSPTPIPTLAPTQTLAKPSVYTTGSPDVQMAAEEFLAAWQSEDYETMYVLLSRLSKDAISLEDFTKRYKDTAINLTLKELSYEILSTLTKPKQAQVGFSVTFNTLLVGQLQREMVMNLTLEDGKWRIEWEDGIIMPELKGGNRLKIDIKIPARGNIYDRNGDILVGQADAYAIGIEPGKIDRENQLLVELSKLTGKTKESIKILYENAGDNWYVPVGEAPADAVEARMDILSNLGGLILSKYTSRFYYNGGIAPQTIGYAMAIPAERLEEYKRLGYRGDEKVGMAGIELWSEEILMGQRGAELVVVDPQGNIVQRLAKNDARPAKSIYTTLDKNLQIQAQDAIAGFKGAIVVLERDTGRILAMVSSPGFDPNLFAADNYNRVANNGALLNEMLGDGNQRLLNRAAEGTYPLGSLFKIVTMSAALESGLYNAQTEYLCGSSFTELEGIVLYDWTYEKGLPPSGLLTLPEGLMRSCNPYFYHIGLDLYRQGLTTAVSDMARAFGLGKPTGIKEIPEQTGSILDPQTDGDAVQMAIGQGTVLVTPLQVAVFIAAIGNGGTLYRPQIIEKVAGLDGNATDLFQPEATGQLPLKPENLAILQQAMLSVTANNRGTAYGVFRVTPQLIYGKTGTAQNPFGNSHAWFGGYTDENLEGKPDIAVVVLAENAGEGSEIAAPIFRRIIEIYFEGKPRTLYRWETTYGVTITPTERYTRTPEPTETPTATPEGEVTITPEP